MKVLLTKNHKMAKSFSVTNFLRLSEFIFQFFPQNGHWIELRLTCSSEIKDLNKRFRKKNKPTDVLSFGSDQTDLIGSIVIDLDTAGQQAKEFKHSLEREVLELFIHGCLHLLGFDHENYLDAKLMEQYENFFAAHLLKNRAS